MRRAAAVGGDRDARRLRRAVRAPGDHAPVALRQADRGRRRGVPARRHALTTRRRAAACRGRDRLYDAQIRVVASGRRSTRCSATRCWPAASARSTCGPTSRLLALTSPDACRKAAAQALGARCYRGRILLHRRNTTPHTARNVTPRHADRTATRAPSPQPVLPTRAVLDAGALPGSELRGTHPDGSRQHRLHAHLPRPRAAHDARSGVLLRRPGQGQVRRQHDDAQLRRDGPDQRAVGPVRLRDVVLEPRGPDFIGIDGVFGIDTDMLGLVAARGRRGRPRSRRSPSSRSRRRSRSSRSR